MGEFDNNNSDNNLDQQGQELKEVQQPQVDQEQAANSESNQPDYAQMQEQALEMQKQAEEMHRQAEQLQRQGQQPEQQPQPQAQQQYQQPRPQQYQQPQYQYHQPYPQQHQQAQKPKSNGLAIASLVLGIISFLSICLPILPLLTAIIGLILGIMSLVKGNGGKGMAIAGVILSGLSLIFGLLIFVGLAAFLSDEGIMSEIRNGIGYEYNYDMWDSFY